MQHIRVILLATVLLALVVGCTFAPVRGDDEVVTVQASFTPSPVPSPTRRPTPIPTGTPPATFTPPALPSPTPHETLPPVGLRVGNTAPDFVLASLDGEQVRLSDLRGNVVLLNFWAVWCGFCRVEMPEMQRAYERYRDDGFVVLAVDVMEDADLVREFVRNAEVTFPVLLDQQGEVTGRYLVRGLPTSFFIDRRGVIMGVQLGMVDEKVIKGYLSKAE